MKFNPFKAIATGLSWALGAATGGAGAWSWLVWLLGGAVLSGGAWLWHGWAADGAHDAAFEAGQAQVRSEQAAALNVALREREHEISRLFGITQKWSKTNADYLDQIDSLQLALAGHADKLQRLAAERRAAVASASDVAALRAYATTAGDVYESCRVEYRALGFDADRCAAAAHTLKGWADEVTSQRGPTQPNPPSRPTQP